MWAAAVSMLVWTQSPVPIVPLDPGDAPQQPAPVAPAPEPAPAAPGPTAPMPAVPLVSVPDATATTTPAPADANAEPPVPLLGAALDLGIPTGVTLEAVLQPAFWVRFFAGPGYNAFAPGGGGGVSFGAFTYVFTPTLTLEGGGYGSGDASSFASNLGHLSQFGNTALKNVDYAYGSVQVGIRAGVPQLGFFLRGGASYLHATLHDFQSALRASTGNATLTAADPTLQAVIPAAQLGVEGFLPP